VKIERRPGTISKFETQGKLRQLLEHLMRCALGMPPAGACFIQGCFVSGYESSARFWNPNDSARFL
jgi:hypothetical protein